MGASDALRLRTSRNPDSRPHTKLTIHHTLHKKIFFFQAKNLHENLRLREKLKFLKLKVEPKQRLRNPESGCTFFASAHCEHNKNHYEQYFVQNHCFTYFFKGKRLEPVVIFHNFLYFYFQCILELFVIIHVFNQTLSPVSI